jgi:hypothetical protein
MKCTHYLRNIAIGLPIFVVVMSLSAAPSGAAKPDVKSVFVMPNDPKEGRDPFYPNSSRPYESSPGSKTVDSSLLNTLKVKSIIDGGDGRVFAIIENHTFAPGDEGTIIDDDGRRMTIRCLGINSKAGTVIVESAGARATLLFSDKP